MGQTPAARRTTLALSSLFFSLGFVGNVMNAINESGGALLSSRDSLHLTIANIVSMFAGAIFVWPVSNAFGIGRRISSLVATGVLLLAAVLAISVASWAQMVACRVFYGLSIGFLYVVGILWRVEAAPAARRGRDVVLLWIAASAGGAIAEWIQFGFRFTYTEVRWRVPLALQLLPILVAVVMIWRANESWRWLLQRGQLSSARTNLSFHLATSESSSEFQRAFAALAHQNDQVSSARTLLSSKHTNPTSPQLHPYRRLFLACLLSTMRSLSGVSAASFYLSAATSAITGYNDRILVTGIPTITLLFSLIPYVLIDRPPTSLLAPFGRRNLLLYSAVGLLAMFLIATILAAATSDMSLWIWWSEHVIPTSVVAGYWVLFLVAKLFFYIGFRPLSDMYAVEIAASNVRTETLSIANAWSMALDVGVAFGVGYSTSLGAWFFLVWMGLNVIWVALIFLLLPETQGRSLELMDGMFVNGLRRMAGLDRNARDGKKIGAGIAEFDGLIDRADEVGSIHAAELSSPPAYLENQRRGAGAGGDGDGMDK